MHYTTLTLLLVSTLLITSCAPQRHAQRNDTVQSLLSDTTWQQASLSTQSKEENDKSLQKSLLALFNQPALNAIVNQSLRYNLDLRLASERLKQHALLANISQSSLYPTVDASLSTERSKDSDRLIDNEHIASVNVSWELDVWGRLQKNNDAQHYSYQEQQFIFSAVQNSIAAQTMKSWFTLLTQHQLVDLKERRFQQLKLLANSVERGFKDGRYRLNDLDIARSNESQGHAQWLRQQQELDTEKHQLQILMGQYLQDLSLIHI